MYERRNELIVERVNQFIDANLDQTLSTQDLVHHFAFSKNQWIRIFKQTTGCAPSRYIRERKVERAKLWLLESDMTVTEIAYQLGFGSVNNFSRMFQHTVGVSPTLFKKTFTK
jgi:AraC-like DNA-binding protein